MAKIASKPTSKPEGARRRFAAVRLPAAVVALGVLARAFLPAADPLPRKAGSAAADEILVKLRSADPGREAALCAAIGGTVVDRIPEIGVLKIRVAGPEGAGGTAARALRRPDVAFAEPDFVLEAADLIPNDPYFPYQWGLRNTGQLIGPPGLGLPRGTSGADIKAAEAWSTHTGGSVLVGVIDTGVDLSHPDLVSRIASFGRDFVNNDYYADDDHGHGTLVAGIIAADTNNGVGTAGLLWNGRLLPVKVFDSSARGTVFDVAAGIVWAVNHDAKVLNMSLGGPDIVVTQTLADAVDYAAARDVIMVAAAGNEGVGGVWYPAAYPGVIAVSGVDLNDVYQSLQTTGGSWGSNYGPEVDLAGPSIQTLSTWPDHVNPKEHISLGLYAYGNKTSMATAFGSGAAALVRSAHPGLTAAQVKDVLERTADDVNKAQYPGRDDYVGWGRINLGRALRSQDILDPPLALTGSRFPGAPYLAKSAIVLGWDANPLNDGRGLQSYRIYRVRGTVRTRLAELAADARSYVEARVPSQEAASYQVAAVNDAGAEGKAAAVIVR